MKQRRIQNIIITAAFSAILILPVLFINLQPGMVSSAENRFLASFPELYDAEGNLSDSFFSDLHTWFDDNLGFRDTMIRLSQWIDYHVFFRSPSSNVLLGRNGWLFYTLDHNLDIATNSYPLDESMLIAIAEQQCNIKDYLDSEGIGYLLTIAPAKTGIYPEYLPYGTTTDDLYTPGEQLQDYLMANTDVRVTALRQAVLDGKNAGEKVFFQKDTHWTELGAYLGYLAMLDALPELSPEPAQVTVSTGQAAGDLSNMIGSSTTESVPCTQILSPKAINVTEYEEYQALIELCVARGARRSTCYVNPLLSEGPRIMIWGDSMFGAWNMVELLAENASSTLYIWSNNMDPDIISAFAPDLVIYEIGERNLTNLQYLNGSIITMSTRATNDPTSGLELREEECIYSFFINGNLIDYFIDPGDVIKIEGYDVINIEGWMIDENKENSAIDVYLQIGTEYFQLQNAFREDVGDVFGNRALDTSGFRGSIPTSSIPSGEYAPVFLFVMDDGTFYRLESQLSLIIS